MRVSDDNKELIQQNLRRTEQEILDEIHRICQENGLRYSLAYGTLLGAVRHKGFIPWDDDIDIIMPREDYDRLVKIWDKVSNNGFLLQTVECNDDYNNNFGKVRKDHTAFIMHEEQEKKKFHKGIFVDIFPMVRQAPGKITRKLQYALFLINLLYNRGYVSGHKGIIGIAEKCLLGIIPKKYYHRVSIWAEKRARRWQNDLSGKWISPCTFEDCKRLYPKELFEDLMDIEFEDKKYKAFSDYDDFLKMCYGDYMTLPPENERVWKHHPIIIDFNHNFEEID